MLYSPPDGWVKISITMKAIPESATNASASLHELIECLQQQTGFADVITSLKAGNSATLDGVWGASRALSAAALARDCPQTLIVVTPHPGEVDSLADDLSLFSTVRVDRFPAWESEPNEQVLHDEIYGDRLRLLKQLNRGNFPDILVTSIQSLLQPVPGKQRLAACTRSLSVGDTLTEEELTRWLIEHGFHSTSGVELPGECSLRGGILDVFAPDWELPVRIEFFGDEIESIRTFGVSDQRSVESLEQVDISLLAPTPEDREHLTAYLPGKSWFFLCEPSQLDTEGRRYHDRLEHPEAFHSISTVLAEFYKLPSVTAAAVATSSLETTCSLPIESIERFSGDINRVREELETVGIDHRVFVVCDTDAEVQRLGEIFRSSPLMQRGTLHFPVGRLSAGFRLVPQKIILVSDAELFHRSDLARSSRRRLGRTIDSFLELREGDLVVHLSHGVGRYRGLKLLEKEEQAEEHLELEYHGGTKIYVPSSKIELVQKYVGGTTGKTKLARIGGRAWIRQKEAAQEAVTDLAAEMIEMQAARASRPGIAFPEDSHWQREFDASFPYQETVDQLSSVAAIKQDMQADRPMDRLLCGDVGFGKTELAIRAAFKAIDSGYQVAVLVPTTVLCEQHLRTFRSRMAAFPFEIASLSRFSTKKQQNETLIGIAEGTIDVVIGTHRLAGNDVTFKNLGLIIIDEEQRFGVEVKEKLKSLRQVVDVLTMTATPIPRTLHLSLLGVRDISNLESPPEDRIAVETRVMRFNDEQLRHAILRELNREGQIYFVHNRVHDIEAVRNRLQEIAPEALIEIGHGQMPVHELEEVMLRFVNHEFDILLATTIVESGLDIPNANTIFIDDAHRYGLADLHQLRGRVGRYKHRAYCYLLLDPGSHITPEAARRLRAIEEFSDMGAGFAIAMRDLELRGAGNLLGTQQSGHIAAVGYELYCTLLENAVRRQKQLPPRESVDVNIDLPGKAFLPDDYVPSRRAKIDLYRRIARMTRLEQIQDFQTELSDRFGPLPEQTERLLETAELRIYAHSWQIDAIHIEDSYLVFSYQSRAQIEQLQKKRVEGLRIVDTRNAYLPILQGLSSQGDLHDRLKSMLQPE